MKRKIALLLAAVMTTAMLPMSAMANSTNSISKKATAQKDDAVAVKDPVALKIYPRDTVTSYSSIILKVDNGKFDVTEWNKEAKEAGVDENAFYYAENGKVGTSNAAYDAAFQEYKTQLNGGVSNKIALQTVLSNYLGTKSNYLPYSVNITSKSEMEVELFPILEEWTDATSNDITKSGKACYNILLPVVASSEGDVKVTIDSNESSISSGTYTIATATSSSGSTTTTIDSDDVKSFESDLELGNITIKEDVAGTFDSNGGKNKIKLRLSNGFVFKSNGSDYGTVKPGTNCAAEGKSFDAITLTKNEVTKDSQIEFTIPTVFKGDTSKACAIVIEGLTIEADDDDKDWGDVNLTVSGGSITTDTIKVGTRADYGFYMKTVEDPTTIISGQSYFYNDDLEDDDFETAELMFGETIKDTWLTQRKLEFTVPEGVKIVDFDIDDTDNITGGDSFLDVDGRVAITNDGRTLRIDNMSNDIIDKTDESEFGISFYVSAAASFEGDITVSVAGAGLAADTLSPVTVATVKPPVTVETTSTKANMGYQSIDTSDIVITETVAKSLLEDKKVAIALDSSYGSSELGFADDGLDINVDGELEYKDFKIAKGYFGLEAKDDKDGHDWAADSDTVKEGSITFKVDKASYTEPSTITISDVKIGTTRSVPYGTYDLMIGDEAVINNYSEDAKTQSKVELAEIGEGNNAYLACFDDADADAIYVKDYLSIATETGTLDGKVEVTIGESTIQMNGEPVEMDTAAYIQESSNSTMVPLRFVSLAIGVDQDNATNADESSKIMWDANTKTATILYAAGSGQKIIQFTAGSATMVVDGTAITMENGVVAEIKDNRMFVPFRALGTALGVSVSWDAETRTAIYNA
jgi:hypothetical protein